MIDPDDMEEEGDRHSRFRNFDDFEPPVDFGDLDEKLEKPSQQGKEDGL